MIWFPSGTWTGLWTWLWTKQLCHELLNQDFDLWSSTLRWSFNPGNEPSLSLPYALVIFVVIFQIFFMFPKFFLVPSKIFILPYNILSKLSCHKSEFFDWSINCGFLSFPERDLSAQKKLCLQRYYRHLDL